MVSQTPGIFIVFDGIDGSGKTTQVNLLADVLKHAGIEVVTSKEPTDGIWGRKIRESAFGTRMELDEELDAFIKDRKEHIDGLILPSLKQGKVVILDRYFYSTIAYQGARGADKEALVEICNDTSIQPDVSLIMDVSPKISQARILQRDGRVNNFEDPDYLVHVRDIYQWQCTNNSNLKKVNGENSIAEIHHNILNFLIENTFKEKMCFKDYGCDSYPECGYAARGLCDWWNLRKKLIKPTTANRATL